MRRQSRGGSLNAESTHLTKRTPSPQPSPKGRGGGRSVAHSESMICRCRWTRPVVEPQAAAADAEAAHGSPLPGTWRRPDLQSQDRGSRYTGYSTRVQQMMGWSERGPRRRTTWRGLSAGSDGALGSGDAFDDGGVGHAAALAHGLQAVPNVVGRACGGRAWSSAGRRTRRAGGRARSRRRCGLSRAGSAPVSASQASGTGANASLTSNAPMSSMDSPDFVQRLGRGRDGRGQHDHRVVAGQHRGVHPGERGQAELAGLRPRSSSAARPRRR